jgi:hypothetical protein
MGFNVEDRFAAFCSWCDRYEIVARLPPRLAAVGINSASTKSHIRWVSNNSLTMFVAKEVKPSAPTNGVLYVITVHQPVWRMMAQNRVHNSIHGVECRLKRTQIE